MFYHDNKLQNKVRVDELNPQFVKMLQRSIGGIEGEIRICLQYLFKPKDHVVLKNTGTCSWVVETGNIAAEMYTNVIAESSGRLLATRLWEVTNDQGMQAMLSFLIARDTTHQNQWLTVLEELGGSSKNIRYSTAFHRK